MQLSLFSLLLFFASQAFAIGSLCATYDVKSQSPDSIRTNLVLKCMHEGSRLYLDGPIDVELIFELKNFAPEPITEIFLNSTGGRVEDAAEVADFIRRHNIKTVLRPGAKCLSACTLLFQAGTKRVSHPTATLMFHSARYPFLKQSTIKKLKACLEFPTPECETIIEEKTLALKKVTNELFASYEDYGASPHLYEDYLKRPEDPEWVEKGNFLRINDWYMSPAEAKLYNIPTSVVILGFEEFSYTLEQHPVEHSPFITHL